jgi:hypothetical protein
MSTHQGSLELLNDPVAQTLLQSKRPLRLAYSWVDGTPRCVPIGFHWNGREIVLGTQPDAPKMRALKDGAKVALTIDSETRPFNVLMIRGSVRTDIVEGIAPEYAAMARRLFGEADGAAWLEQLAPITPQMARIFIKPEWVGLLDFETRFPSALERSMEQAHAAD